MGLATGEHTVKTIKYGSFSHNSPLSKTFFQVNLAGGAEYSIHPLDTEQCHI